MHKTVGIILRIQWWRVVSLTAPPWIVRTDKDYTAPCGPLAKIPQLIPNMAFIIILSWSESFISSKSSTSKWEVLWGPILKKLHKHSGFGILSIILKGTSSCKLKGSPAEWMQAMEKAETPERSDKNMAEKSISREYHLLISDVHWSTTAWLCCLAQLLPISWMWAYCWPFRWYSAFKFQSWRK